MNPFHAWCAEVDTLCRRHLGCSWADLAGDPEPLEDGFADGLDAAVFVVAFKEKYDLDWLIEPDRVSEARAGA